MEDISASADGLIISLRRADADLCAVTNRLETEFEHRFTEGNPMGIMQRLSTLQRELPGIIETCQGAFREKKEIWRATQEQVAANNELLRQLSARAGLPSNSHAAGDGIVQRMQELLDGAGD